VLRLLAVNAGEPVHREVIVDALWPNLPEPAARHNLHVAISSLRRVLDSVTRGTSQSLLSRNGKSYILGQGTALLTDLQRFDALVAHATACRRAGDPTAEERALAAAVECYRGAVLPEDGPADWVVDVRDRYSVAAAEAAGRLADVLLARGRLAPAVAAVTQSLQIDPLRDGSWRTLIAAHEQAGQPAEAARARRKYAAVLESLGVAGAKAGRASDKAPGRPAPARRNPVLSNPPPVKTA
jgi:DNA-binding SARP family transcriptional activator